MLTLVTSYRFLTWFQSSSPVWQSGNCVWSSLGAILHCVVRSTKLIMAVGWLHSLQRHPLAHSGNNFISIRCSQSIQTILFAPIRKCSNDVDEKVKEPKRWKYNSSAIVHFVAIHGVGEKVNWPKDFVQPSLDHHSACFIPASFTKVMAIGTFLSTTTRVN